MAIKKTLGGDRLGSGNQMKVALHNYERSTHDLGNVWRSTMSAGPLVPFYKKICTNGDTWTINLKSLVRTVPATGPCFGSYKLQMDVFEIPIRLYNGILHNNMTKIGMDMAKVKLPTYTINHVFKENDYHSGDLSSDCLSAYLGIRGLGTWEGEGDMVLSRTFNAVPLLAYYDIFKQYYSNKQEESAYVIDNQKTYDRSAECTEINVKSNNDRWFKNLQYPENEMFTPGTESTEVSTNIIYKEDSLFKLLSTIKQINLVYENDVTDVNTVTIGTTASSKEYTLTNDIAGGLTFAKSGNKIEIKILNFSTISTALNAQSWSAGEIAGAYITNVNCYTDNIFKYHIALQKFNLDNIDEARIRILSQTALGTTFSLNEWLDDLYPYAVNYEMNGEEGTKNKNHLTGLVTKTYQSDIFNCWLSSKWIDGIKGINEISAVAVEDGKIKIDALNLSKKVYNMLNRIAVSGGTYEDWQEAVYGEQALRRAESPIYCGGMSGIITFEEIVSTADTETAAAGDQPLGSLAGKGVLTNVKGGNIDIHIKEPSYIMGIVSITPYIDYCQGNDFDMTEIFTLDDLHKPELDEIGFQDLMLETAAHFTTWAEENEDHTITWHKQAGGKQPAWIQYMTSVNQVYGEFASRKDEGLGFMVLTRDYEPGWAYDNNATTPEGGDATRSVLMKDWTTYINPTKYNYQFANTTLDAQNFWVQIGIDATVRRKISARLIPNL